MYRVGPKTPDLPPSGHGPKFWGSNRHASKHSYLLGFCHIGTQGHPKRSALPILGRTISATPRSGVEIRPNLAPCDAYLEPGDPRKKQPRTCNVNRNPNPRHKVPRIIRATAKIASMCSSSLIAIEIEGLAASGEALKNFKS